LAPITGREAAAQEKERLYSTRIIEEGTIFFEDYPIGTTGVRQQRDQRPCAGI
jgi:hypothetical protein